MLIFSLVSHACRFVLWVETGDDPADRLRASRLLLR